METKDVVLVAPLPILTEPELVHVKVIKKKFVEQMEPFKRPGESWQRMHVVGLAEKRWVVIQFFVEDPMKPQLVKIHRMDFIDWCVDENKEPAGPEASVNDIREKALEYVDHCLPQLFED